MYNKNETWERICVTNRHLVQGDFLTQIRRVLKEHPDKLILREKDLSLQEYTTLAGKVAALCEEEQVAFYPHYYAEAAIALNISRIHLPLFRLLELKEAEAAQFSEIGVSIHAVEEAQLAQAHGASYVTAGHVFATDCKKGVPPRGVSFLKEVCKSVSIPVYAIGGITDTNQWDCKNAGAAGVCQMSEYMKC